MDFWEIEFTMLKIEGNLDRIAKALEKMTVGEQNPRCEWCDHRHFPTATCLADDCDCDH